MKITSQALVDFLYNRKLPQIYRDEDSKIGYPLKRYLESLFEGGVKGALEDIENIMLLIDPKAIPEELFPYLCESFGLEYFPDIDVTYQRKFLLNIGELVKRRGTFSSIHFLIRALTSLESELSLDDKTLTITMFARNLQQVNIIEPSIKVIGNYIKTQIPYYITPVFKSKITNQVITANTYSFAAVTSSKSYKLNTHKEG